MIMLLSDYVKKQKGIYGVVAYGDRIYPLNQNNCICGKELNFTQTDLLKHWLRHYALVSPLLQKYGISRFKMLRLANTSGVETDDMINFFRVIWDKATMYEVLSQSASDISASINQLLK